MKPDWLKIRPPTEKFHNLKSYLSSHCLHSVCQESQCPNMSECWSEGTVTFMIMGDTCTRACKFCATKTGKPNPLDNEEPKKLAQAMKDLNFNYIVLTSVDRDDLIDLGSLHFAECIKEIKKQNSDIKIETLIPDFQGKIDLLKNVTDENPDVISHNIETVFRLQNIRDPRASYKQSLKIIKQVKILNPKIKTKSSIILGLGESESEVVQAMKDLRESDVDFLAIGQYLKPKNKDLEVKEYIHPDQFKKYEKIALDLGFKQCASGPFVRTSYHASKITNLLNDN